MNNDDALTREQIQCLDRLAVREFGIPGIVLMENAGRNAARVILKHVLALTGDPRAAPHAAAERRRPLVCIVCGGGNNAGDGFVVSRHLVNCGIDVELYLAADPAKLSGDAAVNYTITERMRIPATRIRSSEDIAAARERWKECDLLVDALLGTGFAGQVRAPLDEVIEAINAARPAVTRAGNSDASSHSPRPEVVAIDLPSGLDADTGEPSNATVRADVTITMAATKIGFDAPGAAAYTGRVSVVDIGAPSLLLDRIRKQACAEGSDASAPPGR